MDKKLERLLIDKCSEKVKLENDLEAAEARFFRLLDAVRPSIDAQRKRAARPRAAATLESCITALARRDADAKTLWPALFAKLDRDGARPKQTDNADPRKGCIEFTDDGGKVRRITFGGFQNKLTAARKSR